MRIYRVHIRGGNFGDDLNDWLWPRLFPEHGWSDRAPDVFVGIGTVLTKRLNEEAGRKVVFGAGIWLPDRLPTIDATWDVRFVRGPISACYLPAGTRFITDAAAALHYADLPVARRTDGVGFMPHYVTRDAVDCARLAETSGLEYIDPRWPVERVLTTIRTCDRIIVEAMHGAIIADLFRIPWCRVSILCPYVSGPTAHSLKWLDWGMSLKVDVSSEESYRLPRRPRWWLLPLYWAERDARRRQLAAGLARLRRAGRFRLSDEESLQRALANLGEALDECRSDLAASSKCDGHPAATSSSYVA